MKAIDKDRRLPKAEYERYRLWLADYQPACQICGNKADDTHHVIFGAYKDDRTLTSLCREHHALAHKHKHEWEDILLPIAKENWEAYNA